MHKSRKAKLTGRIDDDKSVVVGFMERGGKVRTEIVGKRKKHDVRPLVREHVQAGAALYTDALGSYVGLNKHYQHEVIDHAIQYVRGKVHTNTIENFWSLVKRQLHGSYISVEPYHLYRYLDEQMFRFNNRKDFNDSQRFELGMSQVLGKRLTYAELTGRGRIGTPRSDRGGGSTNPLLVLVGTTRFTYTLCARRSLLLCLLPLGPYNCIFGNAKDGFHTLFKVVRCLGSLDVFRLLHI